MQQTIDPNIGDLQQVLLQSTYGSNIPDDALESIKLGSYPEEMERIPKYYTGMRNITVTPQERNDRLTVTAQNALNDTEATAKTSQQLPGLLSKLDPRYLEGGFENTYQNIPILAQQEAMSTSIPLSAMPVVGSNIDAINQINHTVGGSDFYGQLWGLTKTVGLGRTVTDWWDSLWNAGDDVITKYEAEQLAKSYGLDIKWGEDKTYVNKYRAYQSIEKGLAIQQYQFNMAKYDRSFDKSWLTPAGYFATAMGATFFGTPVDFAGTMLSVFAPELLVTVAAKGSGAYLNALKAQKAVEIAITSRRFKAASNALRMAEISNNLAANAAARAMGVSGKVRTAEQAARDIKLQANLEKLSRIKYGNLTWAEKFGADTAGIMTYDIPQSFYKYNQSEQSGLGYYTSQDVYAEILGAGLLGAVLPGTIRGIGSSLDISPVGLRVRQLENIVTDVNAAEAVGQMDKKTADLIRETATMLKEKELNTKTNIRKQPKVLEDQREALDREIVSDEVQHDRIQTVLNWLRDPAKQLSDLKVSDLRMPEQIFTKYARTVMDALLQKPLDVVVGHNMLYERTGPFFKALVNGEEGLLGMNKAWGFTQKEALDFLDNAYRGFLFHDETALGKIASKYEQDKSFIEALENMTERYKEYMAINYTGTSAVRIKASEMVPLAEEIRAAFFNARLGEEAMRTFDMERMTRSVSEDFGMNSKSSIPEDVYTKMSETDKMAQDFIDKWVMQKDMIYVEDAKTGKGEWVEVDPATYEGPEHIVHVQDLKLKSGDKGYYDFESFLEGLRADIDSNGNIVGYDDYYSKMDAARIEKLEEETMNGITLPDTDELRILGNPRLTSEKLKELDTNNIEWKKKSNLAEVDIREIKESDSYTKVNQFWTDKNPLDEALQQIDSLKELRNSKYNSVISGIVQDARGYEPLTRSILQYLEDFNSKDASHIRKKMTEIIETGIAKYSDILVGSQERKIVKEVIDNFLQDIEKNPDELLWFVNDEKAVELGFKGRIKPERPEVRISEEQITTDNPEYVNLKQQLENYKKFDPTHNLLRPSDYDLFETHNYDRNDVVRDAEEYFKGSLESVPDSFPGKIIIKQLYTAYKKQSKIVSEMKDINDSIKAYQNQKNSAEKILELKEKYDTLTPIRKNIANDIKDLAAKYESERDALEKQVTDMATDKQLLNEYNEKVSQFDNERAQEFIAFQKLFSPVISCLDTELSAGIVRAAHNARIMADTMEIMLNTPGRAFEALMQKATQTVYSNKGANRSLEYMSKTSQEFIRAMYNDIKKEERGLQLLDYLMDVNNKNDIEAALIRRRAGNTDVSSNTDADLIAKYIDEAEASLNGTFHQYGSRYTNPNTLINYSKLQYVDGYISDSETATARQSFTFKVPEHEKKITVKEVLNNIDYNDDGFLHGSERKTHAKAKKFVEEQLDEIQKISKSFFELNDNAQQKIICWILRDFDLEKTFNKEAHASMDLNKALDFLGTKDWKALLENKDLSDLSNLTQSLNYLRTRLIGRQDSFPNSIDPISWTGGFMHGFDNLAAAKTEIKAGYLSEFENRFYFKTPEAEIAATKAFGYDSIQEALQRNFESVLRAKYTLENFGEDPIHLVTRVMDAYNTIVQGPMLRTLEGQAKELNGALGGFAPDINPLTKFVITGNQKSQVLRATEEAIGIQDSVIGGMGRFVRILQQLSAPMMLISAGLRSGGDIGTIHAGLITNALADGRTEAAKIIGQATKVVYADPELAKLVACTTAIEADQLIAKVVGNPIENIASMSARKTWLDNAEDFTKKWANHFFNRLGKIDYVTNNNKLTAGFAIQRCIALKSNTPFNELASDLQLMLRREDVDAVDWEMFRNHFIIDMHEFAGQEKSGFTMFYPLAGRNLTDEVLEKALREKGHLNVTKEMIYNYREQLTSKAWNMVDNSANEMVSLPTNRIMALMRFGANKGSTGALLANLVTQFKSFGTSLCYSTYGRKIANAIDGETGITVLDIFNPFVKLNKVSRGAIYKDLVLNTAVSVGTAMIIFDTITDWSKAKFDKWVTDDGDFNSDLFIRRFFAPFGLGADVMDTVWGGIEGTGQGAGGLAVQIAPAISNYARMIQRTTRPLKSKSIAPEDKPKAFASALTSELTKQGGISSMPFFGPFYNYLIGTKIDMQAKGGQKEWNKFIKGKENRGEFVFDWQANPEFIWDRLSP